MAIGDKKVGNPSRRDFIKTATVAGVAAAGFGRSARAAARTVRLGFVSPRTGALAAFAEADEFVLGGVRKFIGDGIAVGGVKHPVEILEKDSRSDPNRAAEVAADLIKSGKVDLLLTANTPETVNPVSDQAELNGVPCITTDAPWQPYFFGRGGKADQGFDWTYHFFWGVEDIIAAYTNLWAALPTNKVVGALWGNDNDGNAYSEVKGGFPPVLAEKGFTLVDPGRFQPSSNDFSAEISAFKRAGVEILTGVLPPPAFATFWSQAAQQGFRPKIATIAKALLFPSAVESLGERGLNLSTEVWWSPHHPFKSGLLGMTAAEFCAEYEAKTGRQWTQPIGFKHALFEVALDVLKRTQDINSPEAIRDAIRATNYSSIVGPVSWTANPNGNPVKNVSKTPLVAGQWVKGGKHKFDLVVVNANTAKQIPTQAVLLPLP
jgi:branched-chain amino acid transport system substrate-binding protein